MQNFATIFLKIEKKYLKLKFQKSDTHNSQRHIEKRYTREKEHFDENCSRSSVLKMCKKRSLKIGKNCFKKKVVCFSE